MAEPKTTTTITKKFDEYLRAASNYYGMKRYRMIEDSVRKNFPLPESLPLPSEAQEAA